MKVVAVAGMMLAWMAGAQASGAPALGGSEISLSVDLTDAPKKLIHATETMAVSPGPMTLVYPKWIPGEHGPTGPIGDQAGFVIMAHGTGGQACGTGDGRLKWKRDPAEMYAFHLTVPEGCATLEIKMDFLATAPPEGFSSGASTGANLAVLSWNTVVVYRDGADAANVMVKPSVTMPGAWQFGTALRAANLRSMGATNQVSFAPAPLDCLIDSPVLAGKYFKEVELAPEITPKHYLDMAADGPEDLDLSAAHVAEFSRLVRETGALFQSRHYGEYHFLVTLSDSVAHFGLEHHESSDDRVAAKTFTEDDRFTLAGDLLPHEFVHSWNGKFRRPAGLATSNYQKPMVGDLLWMYEGMTQYLGDVLAARAGIWSAEEYRGRLALSAATLDNWPGREWRDLEDTARMAQILYDAGGGWDDWRRSTDFYGEGELIWLDVDTTVRKLTDGKKSLNDFAAAFEGAGAGAPAQRVVTYTFDDVVAGLNAVAPNDWAAFLRTRLDSNGPHAPLGGIVNGGYRLSYESRPSVWSATADAEAGTVEFWFSLGLHVGAAGIVADVLKGGPADKAGMGPGMRLVAVNGRGFTPELLRLAVHDTQDGPAVELIVENAGYYKVMTLDYHGGERYPVLEPVAGVPDRLDDILKPLAAK